MLEVALTCVLLATGGLFVRTLQSLEDAKLGFDPQDLTTIVLTPRTQNQAPEGIRQKLAQLQQRISSLPGVESVMTQTSIPFSNYDVTLSGDIDISGRIYRKGDIASFSLVSKNVVDASRMELVQGRSFERRDDSTQAMVGLVNR
jgi:hypothetical protein